MPVVEATVQQTEVPVSIDTSKASVARHAIHAGAEIINDVTALTGDPAMVPLAAETGCGVCVMHSRGTPRTMQDNPVYADVVAEVFEYLRLRRDALHGGWHRPRSHRLGSRASASARPPSIIFNCWPTPGDFTNSAARC